MFAIKSAQDFFEKMTEDFAFFEQNIADSGLAMNCFLSSYHLHEWIWAHWLKRATPRTFRGAVIRDKASFVSWLDGACPHFALLQELANGAKHCSPVHSTQEVSGYGRGPYGIGPFGAPYLLIDRGETLPLSERWLVASDMLEAIVGFWTEFFDEQGLRAAQAQRNDMHSND
jgi:hypothetical protein